MSLVSDEEKPEGGYEHLIDDLAIQDRDGTVSL